jgi:hypothetical protein
MAILCGSYKTKFTALSKLNLVRKILAHVSRAISPDEPRRHRSLAASQTIDFHKAQVRARRARTNENR